jgi:hypothetical protein
MGFLQLVAGVLVGLVIKELVWGAVRTWFVPWYDQRKERDYIRNKYGSKNK